MHRNSGLMPALDGLLPLVHCDLELLLRAHVPEAVVVRSVPLAEAGADHGCGLGVEVLVRGGEGDGVADHAVWSLGCLPLLPPVFLYVGARVGVAEELLKPGVDPQVLRACCVLDDAIAAGGEDVMLVHDDDDLAYHVDGEETALALVLAEEGPCEGAETDARGLSAVLAVEADVLRGAYVGLPLALVGQFLDGALLEPGDVGGEVVDGDDAVQGGCEGGLCVFWAAVGCVAAASASASASASVCNACATATDNAVFILECLRVVPVGVVPCDVRRVDGLGDVLGGDRGDDALFVRVPPTGDCLEEPGYPLVVLRGLLRDDVPRGLRVVPCALWGKKVSSRVVWVYLQGGVTGLDMHFTNHARTRMVARGVLEGEVLECVQKGRSVSCSDGVYTRSHNNVTVVVHPGLGLVITAWRGEASAYQAGNPKPGPARQRAHWKKHSSKYTDNKHVLKWLGDE